MYMGRVFILAQFWIKSIVYLPFAKEAGSDQEKVKFTFYPLTFSDFTNALGIIDIC